MKKQLIIFIISILITLNNFGQSPKLEQAKNNYNQRKYNLALTEYKQAFLKERSIKTKKDIIHKIAQTYYNLEEYDNSKFWYQKLLLIEKDNPIIVLEYSNLLNINGKIEQAKKYYNDYLIMSKIPKENEIILNYDSTIIIENMIYINSKYSDFCPYKDKNQKQKLFFSSQRNESEGEIIDNISNQKNGDIYISLNNDTLFEKPYKLSNINTKDNEGVISIFENEYYFTRCNIENKKYKCKIYQTIFSSGEFILTKEIFEIKENISIKHPSINTNGTKIYYSLKNDSLKNGFDIYYSDRLTSSNSWSEPIILKDVNSIKNEAFPFINDTILYYSSNNNSIGELDIFSYNLNTAEINHLPAPINSTYSDYGIFIENKNTGYFSSNRPNGKGKDDIYIYKILDPLYNVIVTIKDNNNLKPINNVKVKLISSIGEKAEYLTDNNGKFRFLTKPNTNYIIRTEKENYLNAYQIFETDKELSKFNKKNKELHFEIIIPFDMQLMEIEKPIILENIFYEYNSAELKEESKENLNQLIKILDENPNISIEISAHTDYRGDIKYNQILSQKRAESVVNYLIKNNVNNNRLTAKGYGKILPKIITPADNNNNDIFSIGTILNEKYIKNLSNQNQEIANKINRRTEFKVIK